MMIGKDRETKNETTPSTRQHIFNKQQLNSHSRTLTEEWCLLSGLCRDVTNETVGAMSQLWDIRGTVMI
jgi:hypothetical protein